MKYISHELAKEEKLWEPKYKVGDKIKVCMYTKYNDEISINLLLAGKVIGYYEVGYRVLIEKIIENQNEFMWQKIGVIDSFHFDWIDNTEFLLNYLKRIKNWRIA